MEGLHEEAISKHQDPDRSEDARSSGNSGSREFVDPHPNEHSSKPMNEKRNYRWSQNRRNAKHGGKRKLKWNLKVESEDGGRKEMLRQAEQGDTPKG